MRRRRHVRGLIGLCLMFAAACAVSTDPPPVTGSAEVALRHVQQFAVNDSHVDEPGSPTDLRAITYARDYLQSLGLTTYIQSVPLTRLIPSAVSVQVQGPKGERLDAMATGDNFIMSAGRQSEHVSLDADVVFVGYGIVSPEYDRDDYKQANVNGKIVLVLEGAPHTGGRDDLGKLGETYYGTRFYKFAEAGRHGAAAVIIIHSDPEVPWEAIRAESGASIVQIAESGRGANDSRRADIEGWLTLPVAERLLAVGGMQYEPLLKQAHERAFVPIELAGVRVSINLTSRIEHFTSYDVFALLPGQTPEYVLVAGRWNRIDQIITDVTLPPSPPDDDGSGAAVVMEVARKLVAEGRPPRRSVMFMVATALQSGMIGLEYYVEHPPQTLPLDKLTAMIFMDRADLLGASRHVAKIGAEADDALAQITRQATIEQGRLMDVDPNSRRHFYYRFGEAALMHDGVRTIYLTVHRAEDTSAHLFRNVAKRDQVVGLETADTTPPADPAKDVSLIATVTTRVANASNWPPRREPGVNAHRPSEPRVP